MREEEKPVAGVSLLFSWSLHVACRGRSRTLHMAPVLLSPPLPAPVRRRPWKRYWTNGGACGEWVDQWSRCR